MSRATEPDCPRTDVVLARFLDGDARAPGSFDAELDDHLRGCPDCDTALRRARRLDALLAQNSRIDVPDALADQLLTAALPMPATRRRRRVAPVLAAVALLLLGTALGFWLRTPGDNPLPPADRNRAVRSPIAKADAPATVRKPSTTGLDLPAASSSRRHRRSVAGREGRVDLAAILRRRDFAGAVLPGVVIGHGLRQLANPTAPGPTWQTLERTAEHIAITTRIRAGQRLLQSGRRRDRQEVREFLAAAEDGPVLRTLLATVHEDASFVRGLRSRLQTTTPDAGDVRIAARLGHPRIDLALRRLARRADAFAAPIATAITALQMRPGRIALLLDLWADERGTATERRSWFCALPAAATGELIAVALGTNRAEYRVRAITALGWRRDIAALEFLLGQVDGRDHDAMLAAGHAISQLPPAAAEAAVLARMKRGRRPHVLLAALCGMRSDWPRSRMRTNDLTPAETQFLRSGSFTLDQFAIACSLCRRRSLSSH